MDANTHSSTDIGLGLAPAMIIGLDILAGGGEDGVLGMAFDATRRIWMLAA